MTATYTFDVFSSLGPELLDRRPGLYGGSSEWCSEPTPIASSPTCWPTAPRSQMCRSAAPQPLDEPGGPG